jgi:hypothetical protein
VPADTALVTGEGSMSIYENLRREYGRAAPEQRLEILRHELLRPILTVQGVAALLRQMDADVATELPEDLSPAEFERMIQWLAEAGGDLQQIVDALTADCVER